MTGVDAPYEPPEEPELHVRTADLDVSTAVERIIDAIERCAGVRGAEHLIL